jgi:hypothetical protein
MKCNNCGASLDRVSTFCGYCGTTFDKRAASNAVALATPSGFAPPALAVQSPLVVATTQAPAATSAPYAGLTPYYADAYARIDAGGMGASKWNWAAFLFGMFWYFYRGLWGKALLMAGVNIASGGVLGLLFALYCGKFGNYDDWLLRRQGKQLW